LGRGAADGRNEKSGLSCFARHGMGSVGKVEYGKAMQQKLAVIDARIAADVDHYSARLELPLGAREFTRGDGTVINQVMVGTCLLDDFAGESKGCGRGENDATAPEAQACGSRNVVKAPALRCQIVGSA